MTEQALQHSFEPFVENRRSFILLRWLLIILAAYLIFSKGADLDRALLVVAGFFLSNLVVALLPPALLAVARSRKLIAVADAVFVSASLYLLRVEGPQVHLPFIVVFLIALVWSELRVIMFALLVSSILLGALSYFGLSGFGVEVPAADFMSLALMFVIAIFYVFLSSRFDRDSATAMVMLEEQKNLEIMVDMTRTLAASMNADEIYKVVQTGLSSAVPTAQCRVVRIGRDSATIEPSPEDETAVGEALDLETTPVLKRAYEEKKTVASGSAGPAAEVAVPIIAHGEVAGLIWCRGGRAEFELSGTAVHLFEVVAGTAANALRNVGLLDEMKHMARTDYLTGLPNHRYFQQALNSEMGRAQRHERPLSLLVLDLDFLKSVNDRFGHPVGDAVIRNVGHTIRGACREIDFAARYGGEEFVVILPDTDLAGAVEVAERLRRQVLETEVGEVGQISASIGVANYPINALSAEDLVWVADQALYVAKNGGRNQVAHFTYELTNG